MQRTEKPPRRTGPFIVVLLLVLAALGAAGTWMRYASENPSTVDARLEGGRVALASFSPQSAARIRPGMRARGTVSPTSEKFEGRVSSVKREADAVVVSIDLDTPVQTTGQNPACQVTVDTSIPPEVLKQP